MCDMTHPCVWYDSFICVIWLIHVCDMTHSYVWYDSFICVTCLIYMWRNTVVQIISLCYLEKKFWYRSIILFDFFYQALTLLGIHSSVHVWKSKKKKNWRYVRHVSRERVIKMWRWDHLKIRACVKIWRDKCEERKSEDMCVTSRTWIGHENVKMYKSEVTCVCEIWWERIWRYTRHGTHRWVMYARIVWVIHALVFRLSTCT